MRQIPGPATGLGGGGGEGLVAPQKLGRGPITGSVDHAKGGWIGSQLWWKVRGWFEAEKGQGQKDVFTRSLWLLCENLSTEGKQGTSQPP